MERERLPYLPGGIRTLTNNESQHLDAIEKRFTPKNCITCGGTKTFRWWKPGTGRTTLADWDCSCIDQWTLYRYLRHSGVLKAYQQLSWEDVDGFELSGDLKEYVEDPQKWASAGWGLYLHGARGNGKTMLSVLLLKQLLALGMHGYFTSFMEMLDLVGSSWRDAEERRWYYRQVKNAEVLVIDDPGHEYKHSMEFSETTMDEVLRHRVASRKATIITTNLSVKQFEERYGRFVASLLTERSIVQQFMGMDYRPKFKDREKGEVALGLTRPLVTE